MVSAFHQPLLHRALDDDEDDTTFTTLYAKKHPRFTNTLPSDADETEDEEVKMNCIGGIPLDSDYYTSSEDEDDESITSDSNRFDMKVVNFGTRQVQQSEEIISPRVIRGRMIETIAEAGPDDDEQSTSSTESFTSLEGVGARGMPLASETASDFSESDLEENGDDTSESSDEERPFFASNDTTLDDMLSMAVESESIISLQAAMNEGSGEGPELLDLENQFESYSQRTDWEDDSLVERVTAGEDTLVGTSFHSLAVNDDEDERLPKEAGPASSFKMKRCLSKLSMLENERDFASFTKESPKRMRFVSMQDFNRTSLPYMPDFSLGPSAFPRCYEGAVSPSTDDELEQDRQLSEELVNECLLFQDRESTPVPLLTPPASPFRVETEDGATTWCEWPYNLAVDNAMTAAFRMRVPSPDSLQQLEEEEENRIETYLKEHPKSPSPSTTLTPLIQGIAFHF